MLICRSMGDYSPARVPTEHGRFLLLLFPVSESSIQFCLQCPPIPPVPTHVGSWRSQVYGFIYIIILVPPVGFKGNRSLPDNVCAFQVPGAGKWQPNFAIRSLRPFDSDWVWEAWCGVLGVSNYRETRDIHRPSFRVATLNS